MSLLKLKKLQFSDPAFWKVVDSLTEKQKSKLFDTTGGRDTVAYKFRNKQRNAARNMAVEVCISSLDYAALLFHAGITADDIYKGGYNLARVGDSGDYRRRFCRFLTYAENAREKTITDEHRRKAAVQGRLNLASARERLGPEWVSGIGKRNLAALLKKNPRFQHESAAAFSAVYTGSYWANNGKKNLRILEGLPLPRGCSKGRLPFPTRW